jgi:hypothetical protein
MHLWQKVPFVLAYFQASDALRPENSDSDGKDALFGVDTIITILQEKDFGLLLTNTRTEGIDIDRHFTRKQIKNVVLIFC